MLPAALAIISQVVAEGLGYCPCIGGLGSLADVRPLVATSDRNGSCMRGKDSDAGTGEALRCYSPDYGANCRLHDANTSLCSGESAHWTIDSVARCRKWCFVDPVSECDSSMSSMHHTHRQHDQPYVGQASLGLACAGCVSDGANIRDTVRVHSCRENLRCESGRIECDVSNASHRSIASTHRTRRQQPCFAPLLSLSAAASDPQVKTRHKTSAPWSTHGSAACN